MSEDPDLERRLEATARSRGDRRTPSISRPIHVSGTEATIETWAASRPATICSIPVTGTPPRPRDRGA